MSKITKKDIKELRERYEGAMQDYTERIAVLHEKIETLKEMVGTLKHLEGK